MQTEALLDSFEAVIVVVEIVVEIVTTPSLEI